MNKIYTVFIAAIFLAFLGNDAFAQFSISGEFRPRTEYSHGFRSLAGVDQTPSVFTSQRSRLNFNYKADKIVTKLVVQDVRTWGNQKQLVGNEDFATSIHEAWGEAFFTEQLSLKAGRQELIYDDHRIFGNVGWAQQARSHDLALLKYKGAFSLHLGIAYNENSNRADNIYDGPDAYKTMQYLWYNQKFNNLNLSFLFLNNGTPYALETDAGGNVTKERIKYSQTLGPRAVYKMGSLKLSGNFYYQMGKDRGGNDLSAFEGAIDGNYKINDNISAFAGYEILSGTDYDETSTNKSFAPLYGTNHKFNGFMDYFYVGNHANSVGLHDIHAGAKYSKGKFFVQGKVLIFSSAAKISATDDNYLGTEIDLWAGYKIADEIKLSVGYSQMLASKSMEVLKGGDSGEFQNWAYVMLSFTPKFFTYAKANRG